MSQRQIDMGYLQFAWEDDGPDNAYYLDLETGNVELVQRSLIDIDDLTDRIESSRERYLYVPKPDPKQIGKDLQQFMETVTDPGIKRLLLVALEAPDPLFSCHSILSKSPPELERWKAFRTKVLQDRINEWLAANFVV